MGVSTNIYLPDDVRIDDVRTAIGFLSGAEKSKSDFDDNKSWSAQVKAPDLVKFVQTNIPGYVTIVMSGKQLDGENHMAHYFFEHEKGGRMVSTGCSSFWHAIGIKLVQLFGGWIDINDCDDTDCDYSCEKPRETNHPTDGQPWQDFEQALYDLKPITKADLKKDWKKWASELSIQAALDAAPATSHDLDSFGQEEL